MPNAKHLLVIVVGSLIAACFSANKPLDSTQTGNPPVIDTERVALRVSRSDVRVIGAAGAVEPGGAKVEVKNLTTGMSFTTKAAADGSFDLTISGSENDAYSVSAKAGGRTSNPVFVIRGTAAVGDGRDGSLSCEQRNTLAGELLTQAADGADRNCTTDADCSPVIAGASCYSPGCSFAYVSELGRAQIERVGRDIDANLCAEYAVDGCSHALPKCTAPAPAACLMGHCGSSVPPAEEPPPSCSSLALRALARLDDAVQAADRSCMVDSDCVRAAVNLSCREACPLAAGFSAAGAASVEAAAREIEANVCSEYNALGCSPEASMCNMNMYELACVDYKCTPRLSMQPPVTNLPDCVVCLKDYVQWESHEGPAIESRSYVQPCASYERHRFNGMTGDEVTCTTQLVACNAFTSTGAISTALAQSDVQQAVNSPDNPVKFGNTNTGFFRVTIGMHQIELGGSCEGAPPSCIPVPKGLDDLRTLLQQIDAAFASPMGPCAAIMD
jgi:hypothetical protein